MRARGLESSAVWDLPSIAIQFLVLVILRLLSCVRDCRTHRKIETTVLALEPCESDLRTWKPVALKGVFRLSCPQCPSASPAESVQLPVASGWDLRVLRKTGASKEQLGVRTYSLAPVQGILLKMVSTNDCAISLFTTDILLRYKSEWDPRAHAHTKGGYLEGEIRVPRVRPFSL